MTKAEKERVISAAAIHLYIGGGLTDGALAFAISFLRAAALRVR